MRPFLEVADMFDGTFTILSIDPSKRVDGGCVAIVQSVHRTKQEARTALAKHRQSNGGDA